MGLTSLAWFVLPASAQAASFDCGKARTQLEVAICSDARVSKIDTGMGQAYWEAMARLSKGGQQLLRENQLIFLNDLRSICLSTDQLLVGHRTISNREYDLAAFSAAKPHIRCLAVHLRERTKSVLETAVQRFGSRKFLYLTTNRLRRPTPQVPAGYGNHIVEEDISLVQIDAPKSSDERAFNYWTRNLLTKAVCDMRDGEGDGPCTLDRNHDHFATVDTDISASVSAVLISDDLAAVKVDVGYYWLGGAHPFANESRALWSFSSGRALRPTDIFDPRTSWDSSLTKYAQRNARASIDGVSIADLQPIRSIANPQNWSFERGGLRLIFGQYELGGYLGSGEVILPWRIVIPYLRPNGIFDWRAVARGPSGKRPQNRPSRPFQ